MKGLVSANSLGTVAPYVASAALLIPLSAPTVSTITQRAETCIYMDIAQLNQASGKDDLTNYTWDPAQPQLSPDTLVHVAQREVYETYEPFVASEGWREIPAPKGPFLVEEEQSQRAFFDAYDLSAIALYEQE